METEVCTDRQTDRQTDRLLKSRSRDQKRTHSLIEGSLYAGIGTHVQEHTSASREYFPGQMFSSALFFTHSCLILTNCVQVPCHSVRVHTTSFLADRNAHENCTFLICCWGGSRSRSNASTEFFFFFFFFFFSKRPKWQTEWPGRKNMWFQRQITLGKDQDPDSLMRSAKLTLLSTEAAKELKIHAELLLKFADDLMHARLPEFTLKRLTQLTECWFEEGPGEFGPTAGTCSAQSSWSTDIVSDSLGFPPLPTTTPEKSNKQRFSKTLISSSLVRCTSKASPDLYLQQNFVTPTCCCRHKLLVTEPHTTGARGLRGKFAKHSPKW